MADVRWVGPDEWELVREVRLRALADTPEAFGSTYQREIAFAPADWQARFASSATFLAVETGRPVGLVSVLHPDEPTGRSVRQIVSMWIAPEQRGTGVASALVDAVRDWAKRDGAGELRLWIADGNDRGRRFYERMGFVLTGHRQPLRPGSELEQAEMCLPLAAATGRDAGSAR